MIPITDEEYNNLDFQSVEAESLDQELMDYIILGAEPCIAWERLSGKYAIDGITLYLQARDKSHLKVVNVDADYIYLPDEAQLDASPVTLSEAFIYYND